MKIIIVGAGLGGLACAIACRREGLEVAVLERTPEITPIGAGIQLPPNGAKSIQRLGLLEKVKERAITLDSIVFRRYATGETLLRRPTSEAEQLFGAPWLVIHRADYYDILYNEALSTGAQIVLGCEVDKLCDGMGLAMLKDGTVAEGDVIVGADGLWSRAREFVLGHPYPPVETGDLAYRATLSRKALEKLKNPRISELCSERAVNIWLGPQRHAVFYPLRDGEEFNLVLLKPDDLPHGNSIVHGDISEMRASFEGWDEILTLIISCVPKVMKWKLCHFKELDTWVKGPITLLGDACHPTLPYQAQGAAMAVEDGVILGKLLGLLHRKHGREPPPHAAISQVLQLYQSLRTARTTRNVLGAVQNRRMFHLPDGQEQEERDAALKRPDWYRPSEWGYLDPDYNNDLLGFDAVEDAIRAFDEAQFT